MDDTYTCPRTVSKDNWVLRQTHAKKQYAMEWGAVGDGASCIKLHCRSSERPAKRLGYLSELFYIKPVDGKPGEYTIERTDAGEPWTFDLSFVCSADPFMLQKKEAFSKVSTAPTSTRS